MRKTKKPKHSQLRFGIGEWYGRPFAALAIEERRKFAEIQTLPKAQKPLLPCPFQSTPERSVACNKPGGACSFRLYEKSKQTGEVTFAGDEAGQLRIFCPNRFEEGRMIYRWVGETVLHCAEPVVLKEIGFLEPPPTEAQAEEPGDSVGRIDKVLVIPGADPLSWCALEVQAVYFSQGHEGRVWGHSESPR
ncbi:MAG: NotI family restriction endonuclease [Terriglobia bacterium]